MPRSIAGLAASLLILGAGTAAATPVEFVVDPAQSSVNIDAELITPLGSRTDSDTSTVSGSIFIELNIIDPAGNIVEITVHGFRLVIDEDIELNYSYGFLGSANANLTDAVALDNLAVPLGPIGTPTPNDFSIPGVPSRLEGNGSGSYSFLGLGSDSFATDLSTVEPFNAPLSLSLTNNNDGTIGLTSAFELQAMQPLVDGVADVDLTGVMFINAVGSIPQGCNIADLAKPFGVLDLSDINAFIVGFTSQDPIADIAEPAGVFDLQDIQAFVVGFTNGCP